MKAKKKRGMQTEAVHAGEGVDTGARPVILPVYASSTYRFPAIKDLRRLLSGEAEGYLYSRDGNPNTAEAAEKIARMEGAEQALITGSGMAAITTAVLSLAASGDGIVASQGLYGNTQKLFNDHLPPLGIQVDYVEGLDGPDLRDVLRRTKARIVFLESPTNPMLRVYDLAAVAKAAHAEGAVVVIDNTFATPFNQRPLAFGVDVVVHSTTKYLNGHSDGIGGAVAGSLAFAVKARRLLESMGGVLDPAAAALLSRGLKTFPLRMERHNRNGLAVAEFLSTRREVRRVVYPGLPSHPQAALAARQMDGFGGMVTIELRNGPAAGRFVDALGLFAHAASLGGVESLVSLPRWMSHFSVSKAERERDGITDSIVRLSMGIEDVDDLVADLSQALAATRGGKD